MATEIQPVKLSWSKEYPEVEGKNEVEKGKMGNMMGTEEAKETMEVAF